MEIEIEERCAGWFLARAWFALVVYTLRLWSSPTGKGAGVNTLVKHRFSVLVVINGLLRKQRMRTHTHAYGRLVPS